MLLPVLSGPGGFESRQLQSLHPINFHRCNVPQSCGLRSDLFDQLDNGIDGAVSPRPDPCRQPGHTIR